MKSELLNEQDN